MKKMFSKNRKNLACEQMLSGDGVIRGVYITPHVRVMGYHSFHSTTLSKSQITFYLTPIFVERTQRLPMFYIFRILSLIEKILTESCQLIDDYSYFSSIL